MKLFYFHVTSCKDSVHGKVKNQINVFKRYLAEGRIEGFSYIISKDFDGKKTLSLQDGHSVTFSDNFLGNKTLGAIFHSYPKVYRMVLKYLKNKDFTHIYIRRHICDFYFIKFVRQLKKMGISIIYEIPTYPYDNEFKNNSFIYRIEKICRKNLKKWINLIVTPSPGYSQIFEVSVKWIPNGIDVSSIKPVSIKTIENNKTINLIAVAGLSKWHAYERIIEGIRIYKEQDGKRKIVLHLVGGSKDNEFRLLYEELVTKYKLTDNVIFYGEQYGEELDRIYDICDIGVGSLGVHRLGIDIMTTLKSREYLAKGLPMICEGALDIVPDDYKYLMRVPLSEEPINIADIIDFYDSVYRQISNKEVIKDIREFAFKNCDMYSLMLSITEL